MGFWSWRKIDLPVEPQFVGFNLHVYFPAFVFFILFVEFIFLFNIFDITIDVCESESEIHPAWLRFPFENSFFFAEKNINNQQNTKNTLDFHCLHRLLQWNYPKLLRL